MTVDTVAPVVTIESIGLGGIIQDNELGADHTITGTGEAGRLVELAFPTTTIRCEPPGQYDGRGTGSGHTAHQRRHDRDRPGRRPVGGRFQVDVAGNEFSTASEGFEMYTTTRMDADGVLDESQLTANLEPNTVEGGTVITSARVP